MREAKAIELVDPFVEHKRLQGYLYQDRTLGIYRRLAEFLDERRQEGGPIVSKEAAFAWIERRRGESANTCRARCCALREFTRYLVRMGFSDCFLLPTEFVPAKDKSFQPYIFTHEEIERVAQEFDAMESLPSSPDGWIVYPAMFRTIYGCGLRAGEAISLTVGDVDLENGILAIEDAKGDEARYVPISESLKARLASYVERIGADRPASAPFFPGPKGSKCRNSSLLPLFQTRFKRAGVRNQKGDPPRIHDLRHTFAVHSLEAATERGMTAQAFLPILATYMGHKSVASTEYYIHLTLEGQDRTLSAMEESWKDLFKEADDDER